MLKRHAGLLCLSLFLTATGAVAETADDGAIHNDLGIEHYREIARRFPDRIGFVCWVAYETYKGGDFANAKDMFETCAKNNHAQSMIFLSQMYMDGSGVEKDPVRATQWLRRAAETGYSAGQYNYGLALLRGEGTPRDSDAGQAWIGKAAAQGDSDAKTLIAANFDLAAIPAGLGRSVDGRCLTPPG